MAVQVEDDGLGFDPSRTRGMGMMGMRERITLLGGHFEVQSSPGQGTRIRWEVPVNG